MFVPLEEVYQGILLNFANKFIEGCGYLKMSKHSMVKSSVWDNNNYAAPEKTLNKEQVWSFVQQVGSTEIF